MQILTIALLSVCTVLLLVILLRLTQKGNENPVDYSKDLSEIRSEIQHIETSVAVTGSRLDEIGKQSIRLNTLVDNRLAQFSNDNERLTRTVEAKLSDIQTSNEKRLDQMRQTVEEKLQSTLETRLSASFKQVGDQLESVYKQLGEMQNLAKGVGNLERVLTNVKTRGIWGELQAERILQEILLPEQYLKNVATKKGSSDPVEFAVKLPGMQEGEHVLLPIDSKFPREDYERLCAATEASDIEGVKALRKALETRILQEAKDIRDKYIDVPYTTDFAVLFLPVEGLYAEVLSVSGLQQRIQHDCHVLIAGPATLASLLNSLQMGFRTLAIERKSSEVWHVLGEVKTEYNKFGGVLEAVKKKLTSASNEIDNAFTRHRAMERKLRSVEAIDNDGSESLVLEDLTNEV